MKGVHVTWTTLLLSGICLFLPAISSAQTPCDSIIAPESWYDFGSPLVTTPITNCDDPFLVTQGMSSSYTLKIDDQLVSSSSTIQVAEGGTQNYGVEGPVSPTISVAHLLFLHDGNNYRFIDTRPSVPLEADYRALAETFFPVGTDIEPYIATILSGELSFDTMDQQILLDNFLEYVAQHFIPQVPFLRAGTYTLVTRETQLSVTEETFLKKLFASIVPTAYAQVSDPLQNTFTLTFTIIEGQPAPQGVSNILFIPGIMGSRLYEESDVCDSGVSEQERWISRDDCDQLRLVTKFTGESLNEIYTRAGDTSIIDEAYTFNLYKTFLVTLNEWKTSKALIDYAVVPYDWRLRLDDLLKARLDPATGKIAYSVTNDIKDGYLYQTLSKLVQNSTSTGKVTIVAHSNGGLLAKVLLSALQQSNDPLVDKIDNLILVAVPQTGTPDAIVGILHGEDIGPGGAVISQEMARQLMNTMPFAHHLLPNQSYFGSPGVSVETPAITFESGTMTTPWANTYGNTITNADTLHNFLRKDSGRPVPAIDDLLTPGVVDGFLFNYTNMIDHLLSEWVPPAGTMVYEIAGVGLDTPSGITYFTDRECISRGVTFRCTGYAPKLGLRVNHTVDGDGTVVTPSALAMSTSSTNVQRWWLNLKNFNELNFNRYHKDIFEVDDVINFIQNTIQATSSQPYQYLSATAPTLEGGNRLVFYLHSPLDMSVTTESGGEISSSTKTINGATYRRYGELQYISLPKDSTKKTLVLRGLASGSFTLEIEEQNGGELVKRHTYSAIPSGTSTVVQMALSDTVPLSESVLSLDYDGNGISDIKYNEQGEVPEVVTYNKLIDSINALGLKQTYKQLLMEMAKIAQQYNKKSLTQSKYKKLEIASLFILKQQVLLYERLRLISLPEKQEIVGMIDSIMKQ